METKKITIGISACLLGQKVRYDGKSIRDNSLFQKLTKIVTLLPICPEVEIGMPTPRERLNLVSSAGTIQMIAEESKIDWTVKMNSFCKARILKEDFANLSGLILKSKSPSCGIQNVKLYQEGKLISEAADGLFATMVLKLLPTLPIIDELNLQDSQGFDNFISCVNNYANQN